MPALAAYAELVDLQSDVTIASTTLVETIEITRTVDAPGTLKCVFSLSSSLLGLDAAHSAFITSLIAAWGGPTFRNPIKAYLLRVSQDGGLIFDSEMWLESGTISLDPTNSDITIEGQDIASGLTRSYRDRVRFTNTKAQQILYAAPGTIPVDKDALMRPGGTFFYQKGLLGPEINGLPSPQCRTSLKGAHRIAFAGVCDPDIAGVLVNIDSNTDSLANQLTALARAATGALALTNSTLPVGIHQHWVADVINRRVLLGYVGKTVAVTLGEYDQYTVDETAFAALTDEGFSIEPTNERVIAQFGGLGGADTHGLPDGVTITALQVVHTAHTSTAHDFDNSLLVVALSSGQEGGGVFYLVDKTLYQMSQRMDVLDLCYDANTDTLYAATNTGVMFSKVQYKAKTWAQLGHTDKDKGTLSANISKVWSPASGVVYAVASGPQNGPGGNGLFRYPALGGDADNSFVGYMNWSRYVDTGTISDAAGTDSFMYYIDDSSPFTVWLHQPGIPPKAIDTSLGETITALNYDPIYGQVFVLTQVGAIGLYVLPLGSTGPMLLADSGTPTLADDFGSLTVGRVLSYTNGAPINGLTVALLAATDRGLWYSQSPAGGGWKPAAGQNGISDVSATLVAAGMPQTILGRVLTQVWVASTTTLYQSRTGGVYFQDVFAEALDEGPFFNGLAQENGAVPFPDSNVGALGTGATGGVAVGSIVQVGTPVPPNNQALADIGGAGTMYPVKNTDPYAPGPAEVYARRLTELNDTTYRYYDTTSLAPYTQILIQESPEITTDAARNAIVASTELAAVGRRVVQERKQQQVVVNAQSQYETTTAAMRFLKGGDLTHLNRVLTVTAYDDTQVTVCNFANAPMYVLGYTSTMTAGSAAVQLKVGNLMSYAQSPDDLGLIVSGMVNGRGQELRFRQTRKR